MTAGKLEAALEEAQRVGLAEAGRRHGMAPSFLRYHARGRGIKTPYVRRGNTTGKAYDLELAVLCVLFAGRPLSLEAIAGVCGISRQRIEQIEKKALRKVRWQLIEDGYAVRSLREEV